MGKNKIYKKLKSIFTEKQIDEIIDGKEIAKVWGDKEKKVKKTWNKDKKEYNNDVLRCKKERDEEF